MKYTKDIVEIVRKNAPGKTLKEISSALFTETGIYISERGIKHIKIKHGIRSGKVKSKPNAGWFKTGSLPHNTVPVGTELPDNYGYIKVKIANPKQWKYKHILLWEETNGSIPKGHNVSFIDGNIKNVTIENLCLIKKEENAYLNRNRLRYGDRDTQLTNIGLAKLIHKIKIKKESLC